MPRHSFPPFRLAPAVVAIAVASGCSLAGLADGGGGEGGEPGAVTSNASTATSSSATLSGATSASSSGSGGGGETTSSQSTAASTGGGSSEGGGGAANDGGGGGGIVSDLFTWAERSGGDAQESTLDDDGRLAMATLADGTVVVASVIEEEDDEEGDPQDRLSIVGLRPAGDVWSHVFEVSIGRHDGGGDGTLILGGVAAQGDRFAVALAYRGILELDGGDITSSNQDGVVLVGTVGDDGTLDDLAPTLIAGGNVQIPQSVAFLDDGDLLVGGRYSQELNCPTLGVSTGDNRGFVARYRDGECLVAMQFGTLGGAFVGSGVRALAVRGDLALAAGSFGGTLTLGGDDYVPSGNTDAFAFALAVGNEDALPLAGDVQVFGGDSRDIVSAVVPLEDGFVLSGVTQNGDLGERCGVDDLSNKVNAYVARFALDGTCDWLRAWETDEAYTHGARALIGDADDLLVAGPFHRISPCGDEIEWSGAASDGFVFRLDPATGKPSHGVWIEGAAEQSATALAPTGDVLGPMVGGSYDFIFDPWLGEPASVDLYVGALRPMQPLGCQ